MSVLRWSVVAATCMNFCRSSYTRLSFGELYKHPTPPHNCPACITHAGLHLLGHIMKLSRLSMISLSGAAGGAPFKGRLRLTS